GGNLFATARLTSNGSIDPSFGSAGRKTDNVNGTTYGAGFAVQPDGKILRAGTDSVRFVIARYSMDGQLDPSFAGGGISTVDVSPQADIAQGVIVQSDGRILVAGSGGQCEGNSCLVATRLMTDGTLDQSFGQRGLVVTGVAMTVTRVLTQADGKLVFSGATPTSNFAIARMNSDGTMDTRFGG